MIPNGRLFRLGVAAGLAVLMVALSSPTSGAAPGGAEPGQLTTEVFADVPYPGHPEGVAVADDGTVYVGTHQDITGGPGGPSSVFAYDHDGRLKRQYVIAGQDETGQGIVGMALDGNGRLFILDRHPARVITLDPETGEQHDYAYLRDVPPCSAGQSSGDCSATTGDAPCATNAERMPNM